MFWGLTPALDLLEEYKNIANKETLPHELNILLVGSTDCRHILKTLAKRYQHQKVSSTKLTAFINLLFPLLFVVATRNKRKSEK